MGIENLLASQVEPDENLVKLSSNSRRLVRFRVEHPVTHSSVVTLSIEFWLTQLGSTPPLTTPVK